MTVAFLRIVVVVELMREADASPIIVCCFDVMEKSVRMFEKFVLLVLFYISFAAA